MAYTNILALKGFELTCKFQLSGVPWYANSADWLVNQLIWSTCIDPSVVIGWLQHLLAPIW